VLLVLAVLAIIGITVHIWVTRPTDRELCEDLVDEEVDLNQYFSREDAIRVCLGMVEED
jgi:hypothetical protein